MFPLAPRIDCLLLVCLSVCLSVVLKLDHLPRPKNPPPPRRLSSALSFALASPPNWNPGNGFLGSGSGTFFFAPSAPRKRSVTFPTTLADEDSLLDFFGVVIALAVAGRGFALVVFATGLLTLVVAALPVLPAALCFLSSSSRAFFSLLVRDASSRPACALAAETAALNANFPPSFTIFPAPSATTGAAARTAATLTLPTISTVFFTAGFPVTFSALLLSSHAASAVGGSLASISSNISSVDLTIHSTIDSPVFDVFDDRFLTTVSLSTTSSVSIPLELYSSQESSRPPRDAAASSTSRSILARDGITPGVTTGAGFPAARDSRFFLAAASTFISGFPSSNTNDGVDVAAETSASSSSSSFTVVVVDTARAPVVARDRHRREKTTHRRAFRRAAANGVAPIARIVGSRLNLWAPAL